MLQEKISIPFPDEPGSVFVTPKEHEQLLSRLGEPCLFYLCEQLEIYAEEHPKKFAAYRNHARVIMRWHQMKVSNGYEFYEHPTHGPGYYRTWIIEKLTGSSGDR